MNFSIKFLILLAKPSNTNLATISPIPSTLTSLFITGLNFIVFPCSSLSISVLRLSTKSINVSNVLTSEEIRDAISGPTRGNPKAEMNCVRVKCFSNKYIRSV